LIRLRNFSLRLWLKTKTPSKQAIFNWTLSKMYEGLYNERLSVYGTQEVAH
jgi:hypothetical protein